MPMGYTTTSNEGIDMYATKRIPLSDDCKCFDSLTHCRAAVADAITELSEAMYEKSLNSFQVARRLLDEAEKTLRQARISDDVFGASALLSRRPELAVHLVAAMKQRLIYLGESK